MKRGIRLDVLNTGGNIIQYHVKTRSGFQFIKANKDMKYITLVPVEEYNGPEPVPNPVEDINKFPIVLKVNPTGNILVNNILFTQDFKIFDILAKSKLLFRKVN